MKKILLFLVLSTFSLAAFADTVKFKNLTDQHVQILCNFDQSVNITTLGPHGELEMPLKRLAELCDMGNSPVERGSEIYFTPGKPLEGHITYVHYLQWNDPNYKKFNFRCDSQMPESHKQITCDPQGPYVYDVNFTVYIQKFINK